ncbi:phosphate ABC transporter permease subunit PstC [Demequina sp. NBRC 110056]|uniref:phosphate ABC transporter permease subunit PstC n=1 Tax=Demequina sp. NBRC 110056 TaxID=1570345 RepID=UPI000A06A56D|nr:phosphate ABC transporter permease subunit PstC [Demequina sp. NBRC 110056]
MTTTTSPPPATEDDYGTHPGAAANRFFKWLSTGAGALILITLAAVASFLLAEAWPAMTMGAAELGESVSFIKPDQGQSLIEIIGYLVYGTLLISIIALIIATPVSIGIALFISHYAPRKLSQGLGYLIDLLAAVPSVVYGLWGVAVLVPVLTPFYQFLADYLGFIPLFAPPDSGEIFTGRVAMSAGIVLAIMIIPIITAVSREVFLQTPTLHEEAALAMGATRWEMIKMSVFPFGRSGMVGATMLGLGRALGETMAVLMIIGPGLTYTPYILQPNQHNTIAAYIALQFPEANALGVNSLIAMGLALFLITLLVNMLARWIVSRRSEFSGAN